MTMLIDSHVHLWNRALDPQPWIDPVSMAAIDRDFGAPELRDMLASTGVDRAVVVQASNSFDESIRLSRTDPALVAGLVAWVDLTGDVGSQLDLIRLTASVPIVGVRHLAHIDPDPEWLLREDVGNGLAELQRAGICFDLVIREWQLPQAVTLAERHDELRFVLDHLGGPPAPGEDAGSWASGFTQLARRQNVVAKISGVTSGLAKGAWKAGDLRPVVDRALDAFGPERLMYGSDWPLAELGGGAPTWKAALETLLDGHSASDREKIFGATAAAVYSLD